MGEGGKKHYFFTFCRLEKALCRRKKPDEEWEDLPFEERPVRLLRGESRYDEPIEEESTPDDVFYRKSCFGQLVEEMGLRSLGPSIEMYQVGVAQDVHNRDQIIHDLIVLFFYSHQT